MKIDKWKIDKRFDFCYGHRVHCQTLNQDYTERGHTKAKCRHLHGHQGHAHVFLEAPKLNHQGMVVDFTWLGWLKDFIDDYVDHKFILDVNDPWFNSIVSGKHKYVDGQHVLETHTGKVLPYQDVSVPHSIHKAGDIFDTSLLEGDEKDFYEGFFLVNFVPTSEKLSEWLFYCVKAKMDLIGVDTSEVWWFETPKSRAAFSDRT